MLITNTINKKILESIIHETFSNFGNITCDKVSANNMIKKSLFNFTCSTPTIINGTTYYRYDINLDLYTTYYSR